jgi:lipopolysaccharide heptosyltransferase II
MSRLHIYDRRERLLVGTADRVLRAAAAVRLPFRWRRRPHAPRRILLLRLERIGDLLMAVPAIADIRVFAPDAGIDLVVGSWNEGIAGAIPAVDRVLVLDAHWLAREGGGLGLRQLLGAAREWRAREYDLAINFEPDIRSNLLLAAAGARWTVGYSSGGGGALLDVALDYDTAAHTIDNARRLVATAVGAEAQPRARPAGPSIVLSPEAQADAARRLEQVRGTLVGIHTSGGRAVKQWNVERFGEVARRLIQAHDVTVVLTGSDADRPLVDGVKQMLPPDRIIDLAGDLDLQTLAAVLARLDLFVTGDTGPMHIASAVGTPIVAVFGPSDPARYGPRGPLDRIVRIDLPCSPCNRIRLPPERCIGHIPDCLSGISVSKVFDAADEVLRQRAAGPASRGGRA